MNSRLEIAIQFLKDGMHFTVDDVRIGITDSGVVEVTGWSQWTDFRNLSKAKCIDELADIKKTFSKMINSSADLKSFLEGKEIDYHLDFDDYGKVSIGICSEKNHQVIWHLNLD